MSMQRRIAVRGIVVLDGKLLCFRLKPYRNVEQSTHWSTPGGGIDDGEAIIPALEREMIEETGIPANVGRLLYVQQYNFKGQENLEFFFEITNAKDYLNIDLSKTTHGETEIAEFGFIDPSDQKVLPEFLQTVKFDEANFSTPQVFNYL
ncbi:MAG: hydrolase [Candidatus Saccharibacteria bacterium]|nr:hydrolase [Candidatus Saccharibacteria bacterium]